MSMHLCVRRAAALIIALGTLSASVIARQATGGNADAAKVKNPVASTPESIAAGKKVFDTNCASCHGPAGKGGVVLSVIEDQGGTQPPAFTEGKFTHGSTDGEIFATIKKGVGPQFFMAPWDGRIPDTDIWNTINYLRTLTQK
jgi:mono/diheme cytochrome c family protein